MTNSTTPELGELIARADYVLTMETTTASDEAWTELLAVAIDMRNALSRLVGDDVVERVALARALWIADDNNPDVWDNPQGAWVAHMHFTRALMLQKADKIIAALSPIPVSTEHPLARLVALDEDFGLYDDESVPLSPNAEPSGEVVQVDIDRAELLFGRLRYGHMSVNDIAEELRDHRLAFPHPSERAQLVALLQKEAGPPDGTLIFEMINGLAAAVRRGDHLSTPESGS
jgi:hypothetical protein